jgi:serine protease Do
MKSIHDYSEFLFPFAPWRLCVTHRLLFVALTIIALASEARAQDDVTAQEEAAFKSAVEVVAPSVVKIETFGGSEKVGGVLVGSGPTTGLVVGEEGYILSSAFNFIQKPASILVTLPSGKRASASIVARDHSRMLVLLKVASEEKLVVPAAVPRSEMQVGQWAIAVGRTFDQKAPNISVGVISALHRIWGRAIQADAKISPSNYGGPLVDIQGRVLGILVPMSPQGGGEVAGAEWYDSGIGFAVPLAEMLPHLDTLKRGEDLNPGLMGISLKPGDMNADPAVIVSAQAKGPAAKAGIKAQDKIVAINGQPIDRQGQLKHALGPLYAGEKIKVAVLRGEARLEKELELVEKMEPYEHPLLGILPLRDKSDKPGVAIRFVFPDSPAAEAGLAPQDRITSFDGKEIKDAAALGEALAALEPGAKVTIKYTRGEEEKTAELTLAVMTSEIPADLPAAHAQLAEAKERPNTATIEIKVPEEKNECYAYVPEKYHADAPHGLLIALHNPGAYDKEKLIGRYQAACDDHELILLVPRSAEATKWDAGDAAFIKKAIDEVAAHYNIDKHRVAITGYQASGAMAWMTAITHPESIRGVVAVEAPLPQRARLPDTDPAQRLWLISASSSKSPQKDAIAAGLKRIEEQKHLLFKIDTGATPRELHFDELQQVGRWLDSLDRL